VSHRHRFLTAALVAVVAASSLVGAGETTEAAAEVPAAPSAATGVLNWEISDAFDTELPAHYWANGASEGSDGVISFPAVSSTVDPATGAGTVQFRGLVRATSHDGGQARLSVGVQDPAVVVDADGEGYVTAVVWAWNAGTGGPEESTSLARVVVTTFDAAGTWSAGSITATPDWAGVLPAGSPQASALGIPDGQPVDGKAFAPTYLAQLTGATRPLFYATSDGGATDAKAPSSFTASYQGVARSVTVWSGQHEQTVSIEVNGVGFTATDGNPGDGGVYVGLAPAGGLPAAGTAPDLQRFVTTGWVPDFRLGPGGSFSVVLYATAAELHKGTSYAVYTWRAHGHSTTTQDSVTAIALDWSTLTLRPDVRATFAKKPTRKRPGVLSVAVTGGHLEPSGVVRVTLRKGKVTKTRKATVERSVARVRLPALPAGRWRVRVAYTSANDAFAAARTVLTLKVAQPKKKR